MEGDFKKYDEIQLTKKMDLNNRKMKNHPPSQDMERSMRGHEIKKSLWTSYISAYCLCGSLLSEAEGELPNLTQHL